MFIIAPQALLITSLPMFRSASQAPAQKSPFIIYSFQSFIAADLIFPPSAFMSAPRLDLPIIKLYRYPPIASPARPPSKLPTNAPKGTVIGAAGPPRAPIAPPAHPPKNVPIPSPRPLKTDSRMESPIIQLKMPLIRPLIKGILTELIIFLSPFTPPFPMILKNNLCVALDIFLPPYLKT